jgi:hypothetical protein
VVLSRAPLTIDPVEAETALRPEHWFRDLAKTLGAEVLVADDTDG